MERDYRQQQSTRLRTTTPLVSYSSTSTLPLHTAPPSKRSKSSSGRNRLNRVATASTASSALALRRHITKSRLGIFVIGFLFSSWIGLYLFDDFIVLCKYKLREKGYEEGWIRQCGMRKKPLMFIQGEGKASIVWETNCDQTFDLYWDEIITDDQVEAKGLKSKGMVRQVKVIDETNTHWVYQSVLSGLVGGKNYVYEITPVDSEANAASLTPIKPLARQVFPFLGPVPFVPTPTIINIAAFSDNQFNLRIFHRILRTLLSYTRSLPSSSFTFSSLPSLIIHAGDQVENPSNLPQWATDFWDPMSALMGQMRRQVPILLARGNHDWDKTGENVYTGGAIPRSDWIAHRKAELIAAGDLTSRVVNNPRATYMAYSPHERCRIIVLDSNIAAGEETEQEEWLLWELEKKEWKDASLRIVVVHVPPFLEYWDKALWTTGGESKWSSFVRTRLTPLLSHHQTSLVLSGHQHAYSRGFLSRSLHPTYTSPDTTSASLSPSLLATARRYASVPSTLNPLELTVDDHHHIAVDQHGERIDNGTLYIVFGGSGGGFDRERVEDWGFYERSVKEVHHFGWMRLGFGEDPPESSMTYNEGEGGEKNKKEGDKKKGKRGKRKNDGVREYRLEGRDCAGLKRVVEDSLEWHAVGLRGNVIDRVRIVVQGCD